MLMGLLAGLALSLGGYFVGQNVNKKSCDNSGYFKVYNEDGQSTKYKCSK